MRVYTGRTERCTLPCAPYSAENAEIPAQWGTYFATTSNTLLNTSATAADNKIMTRTKADSLIVEDGKVTGVNATMYDGTPVTAHATKGVVLATGGYAANIALVQSANVYWDPKYITDRIRKRGCRRTRVFRLFCG